MKPHQLWAGTLLLIAAVTLRSTTGGGWQLGLLVLFGIVLIVTSLSERKGSRDAG